MNALCPEPATAPRGTLVAVPYGTIRGWQLAVVDGWVTRIRSRRPATGLSPDYVRVFKWLENSGRWSAPMRLRPEVCIHLELRFGNMPDEGAPDFPPGPQARKRIAWVRQANREAAAEEAEQLRPRHPRGVVNPREVRAALSVDQARRMSEAGET